MVTTRHGTSTAGKSVVAPLKGKRKYRAHKDNATIRHVRDSTSYKSSAWANGGPFRDKRHGNKVKYHAMTKKKRKNLFSRTQPESRVKTACATYKAGNPKRTKGKKIMGARVATCADQGKAGKATVCPYVRKSKRGKRVAVSNHCRKCI